MTEKIEWYKEVLELEPNSKLFFPLARMLAAKQRYDDAIAVLQHGLERHAEYLEARLFFIELLHMTGRRDACVAQVERLSSMFSVYAGFWQAWAACLTEVDGEADTAAVLRFLAAHFLRGHVTLHEIIDRGVSSLLATRQATHGNTQTAGQGRIESAGDQRAPTHDMPATGVSGMDTGQGCPHCEQEPDLADDLSGHVLRQGGARDIIQPDSETLSANTMRAPVSPAPVHPPLHRESAAQPAATGPGLPDDDDGEERFSLRTRSMAEVLAEQGDIKGALDIYLELEAAAVGQEEKADLQQRISTLSTRLGHVQEQESQPPHEAGAANDRLISMLEALAQRVEARAQS